MSIFNGSSWCIFVPSMYPAGFSAKLSASYCCIRSHSWGKEEGKEVNEMLLVWLQLKEETTPLVCNILLNSNSDFTIITMAVGPSWAVSSLPGCAMLLFAACPRADRH